MPKYSPNKRRLQSLLAKFPRKRILVLGDLMLDHFIRGTVARISPEAPVPVVAVNEESHAPGGAGNVASNLTTLGADVSVFSVIGRDTAGDQLIADMTQRGADTSGILRDETRVTTQKCRVVAEHQQIVRYDRETLSHLSAASRKELTVRIKSALPRAHALVISDYGKGLVTEKIVRECLRAAHKAHVPVLVDPKVEHFKTYHGVDCMTPNIHEAWAGMRMLPSPKDADVEALGRKILKALHLRSVLITRGERGMSLFESGPKKAVTTIATQAKEVFDVTGAGDTVISLMALGLASGAKLDEAAYIANAGAGVVVGKLGTATTTIMEIRKALSHAPRLRL